MNTPSDLVIKNGVELFDETQIYKSIIIDFINEEIRKTQDLINNSHDSVDINYYTGKLRGYENILNYITY